MNMKRVLCFSIGLVLIGVPVFRSIAYPATYTVQKNDTLSQIASNELGNWKRWEELAMWNNLDVEWKEGVAYVWIKPGQEIRLTPYEKVWMYEDIEEYMLTTKRVMEEEIFRMAGIRKPYPRHDINHINTYLSSVFTWPVADGMDVQYGTIRAKRAEEYLKHQSRYIMVDEIIEAALYMKKFPFKKSKHPWQDHRKMSLLLLALLDVESNGFFVRGSHSEVGPYQIKPRTYALTMGMDGSLPTLEYIERTLMVSSKAGLDCAIKILQSKDDMPPALAYYNRGSDKRLYARKIIQVYNKFMEKTVTK